MRFVRLILVIALLTVGLGAAVMAQGGSCGGSLDLHLTNGNIVTMDAANPVVSSVVIRDGRFAVVGGSGGKAGLGPCAQTINLQGRTVVPGLIDSHVHFLRAGLRPGHDVRSIETAFSVKDVQEILSERASTVPAGEFLTAIGGYIPDQFAEGRLPDLAELDQAAPDHPVYLQAGFRGPSVTNSIGKSFFEGVGVSVAEDGSIADAGAAFAALAAGESFEDHVEGTRDLMIHSNSLGLTMALDTGGGDAPGVGFFDSSVEVYEPSLTLWRDGRSTVRVRPFFISRDTSPDLPAVTARIENSFSDFGDGMYKTAGLGEEVVDPSPSALYVEAVKAIAGAGWGHTQHSSGLDDNQAHLAGFEEANAVAPIADLHWTLAHVFGIDQPTLDGLASLGAGVTVQNQRYLSTSETRGGPPYRLIVDSGIPVGAGTDATNVAPMNPWLSIYYMVTGKNVGGHPVNAGQTVSREEALELYTLGSAWVSRDDDELGSIEPGKLADLAVLTDDYFSVEEEAIRSLGSVLTVVNGDIVYSDGSLTTARP